MKQAIETAHSTLELYGEYKKLLVENARLRKVEQRHNEFISRILKQDAESFSQVSKYLVEGHV